MKESVFIQFFGGVPFCDVADAFPLIPFGRWLLPVSICLLAAGYYAERNRRWELLSAYRYGTAKSWWRKRFGKGILGGVLTAALLMLFFIVWDMIMGKSFGVLGEQMIKISILWLFHIISMYALFLLLDLFGARRVVPAALLLFEGVTFVMAFWMKETADMAYGMWGMYFRSGWYIGGQGFRVRRVLTLECLILAVCYYGGKLYVAALRRVKRKTT